MLTPIIIFLLLITPLSITFIYSRLTANKLNVKKYACWGLGLVFLFTFIGHFIKTEGMVEMLPPWLPFRLTLVYLSGIFELFLAIALFIPKYQTLAAKIAIIAFIVFFPVNIYAALNSIGLGGHQWGPSYLLIRGPLQLILILWGYFLCYFYPRN